MNRIVFAAVLSICCLNLAFAALKDKPIALDSRIKTYIYSENEIFRLVVHYGYQTSIEFADGEEIQTISTGNNFAWQLTPIGRRLFIKPLEENIITNMTILTSKRTYHMEVQSKGQSSGADEELAYVIRFFYPSDDFNLAKSEVVAKDVDPIPTVKPFNFNYTLSGADDIAPLKVFDDGINTFFKFPEGIGALPTFEVEGASGALTPRQKGAYIIINVVADKIRLVKNNHVVTVYNENLLGKR